MVEGYLTYWNYSQHSNKNYRCKVTFLTPPPFVYCSFERDVRIGFTFLYSPHVIIQSTHVIDTATSYIHLAVCRHTLPLLNTEVLPSRPPLAIVLMKMMRGLFFPPVFPFLSLITSLSNSLVLTNVFDSLFSLFLAGIGFLKTTWPWRKEKNGFIKSVKWMGAT